MFTLEIADLKYLLKSVCIDRRLKCNNNQGWIQGVHQEYTQWYKTCNIDKFYNIRCLAGERSSNLLLTHQFTNKQNEEKTILNQTYFLKEQHLLPAINILHPTWLSKGTCIRKERTSGTNLEYHCGELYFGHKIYNAGGKNITMKLNQLYNIFYTAEGNPKIGNIWKHLKTINTLKSKHCTVHILQIFTNSSSFFSLPWTLKALLFVSSSRPPPHFHHHWTLPPSLPLYFFHS